MTTRNKPSRGCFQGHRFSGILTLDWLADNQGEQGLELEHSSLRLQDVLKGCLLFENARGKILE